MRTRRKAVAVAAPASATLALGATVAVLVAGSAAAASSKTPATRTPSPAPLHATTTTGSPGDSFLVVNGTVNAASDHEIVGSSAFPNFTTGAVDNYYAMAHAHVDNSPFAEGTASPADTGPIGQTAAAGNFQQPQYADARWPGDSGTATYGTRGQPYAEAAAGEYQATAGASEASNGLSGPGLGGSKTLALPRGFDLRLRQALAAWKAKWQGPLGLKPASPVTTPVPEVTVPKAGVTVPKAGVTVPRAGVTVPKAAVTTPVATATTPPPVLDGTPSPPVTVPAPTLPSAGAEGASRSLASLNTSRSTASPSGDGESLLTSSTRAILVPGTGPCKPAAGPKPKAEPKRKPGPCRTYTLVTSGESSLGRVSLGGGQIVIEGIHVTASIANDGTPAYKAAVSIAAASIGGVPVTIDQDGVHIAGQGQGLPYRQAGDALNGALKQAGIQLFLVSPEVTTNACGQPGTGGGAGTGGGPTASPSDQSGTGGDAASSCDQQGLTGTCDQTGTGSGIGTGPGIPTPTPTSTSTDRTETTPPDSCGQPCDQASSGTGTTTATSTTATTTSGPCGGTGMTTATGSCSRAGTGTTTTSTDQTGTTAALGAGDQSGPGDGASTSGEETVTATGLHVVFTQPVNQSGVPSQYVEHILGEVFVDSLAVPAGAYPGLGLSSSSSVSSSSSSCLGGQAGGTSSSLSSTGGAASAGGSTGSGSLSPSGAAFGSGSQPGASTGASLPAAFAAALRKPLWLLLAYVLWQALVIATGASLWNWRRGGAS